MELELEHSFDPTTYRHYRDGILTVLHCHHYLALTTKLAEDFADIGAVDILAETTEDSIRPVLDAYVQKKKIINPSERMEVGRVYYSEMGLGLMDFEAGDYTNTGGRIKLLRSHVDLGWIRKWGNHDKHINHFSRGYIAAMFGASFRKPPRSYQVTEVESKVTGANANLFEVVLRG